MMKIFFFAFVILTLLIPSKVSAIVKPLDYPNNKYGIHVATTDDLEDAANLVNSSGGDWGYVTLVIRENERDVDRWQKVFNMMRDLHLIPIVRIATIQENGGWKKPSIDEIDSWVNFFESLNWVVKNRYVIIFNEPNHAKEWGSEISAIEYSTYLKEISIHLKGKNEDYFILPAGFDASAPNSAETMDQAVFIRKMILQNPDIFDRIDGWTSHSYPNPDFSGSEDDVGRGSVKTYEWEINLLKSLGVDKQFPIFITETGWVHNGEGENNNYKSVDEISDMYQNVFNNTWNDANIVAITPFILNYTEEPFNKFSWKKSDGSFYTFYQTVKNINKIEGRPKQNNYWVVKNLSQFSNIIDKNRSGAALVKNLGQITWSRSEYFEYVVNDNKYNIVAIFPTNVNPGDTSLMFYTIKNEN